MASIHLHTHVQHNKSFVMTKCILMAAPANDIFLPPWSSIVLFFKTNLSFGIRSLLYMPVE